MIYWKTVIGKYLITFYAIKFQKEQLSWKVSLFLHFHTLFLFVFPLFFTSFRFYLFYFTVFRKCKIRRKISCQCVWKWMKIVQCFKKSNISFVVSLKKKWSVGMGSFLTLLNICINMLAKSSFEIRKSFTMKINFSVLPVSLELLTYCTLLFLKEQFPVLSSTMELTKMMDEGIVMGTVCVENSKAF